MRLQIDRQHDQEDDDKHVRHARPIRHRRYIVAPVVLGEPPSEVGVVQIAERQCDAESRKDPAIDDIRRQVDDMQTKSGQHYDVQNDIGEQTKKPVPIARDPPARRIG